MSPAHAPKSHSTSTLSNFKHPHYSTHTCTLNNDHKVLSGLQEVKHHVDVCLKYSIPYIPGFYNISAEMILSSSFSKLVAFGTLGACGMMKRFSRSPNSDQDSTREGPTIRWPQ